MDRAQGTWSTRSVASGGEHSLLFWLVCHINTTLLYIDVDVVHCHPLYLFSPKSTNIEVLKHIGNNSASYRPRIIQVRDHQLSRYRDSCCLPCSPTCADYPVFLLYLQFLFPAFYLSGPFILIKQKRN